MFFMVLNRETLGRITPTVGATVVSVNVAGVNPAALTVKLIVPGVMVD
jgi:hypothetical protein